MSGTHFNYDLYFNKSTYDWILVPEKIEFNLFCLDENTKLIGKAIISLYNFLISDIYGIVTITEKDVNVYNKFTFDLYFANIIKIIHTLTILDKEGNTVGNSQGIRRKSIKHGELITNKEKRFYSTLELAKRRFKINNYFVPIEMWEKIYNYLDPFKQEISLLVDPLEEKDYFPNNYGFNLYISWRIGNENNFYSFVYPHEKKQARSAVCKYNNWDDGISGLELLCKGRMYKTSENYIIYFSYKEKDFYDDLSMYYNERLKILDLEGNNIFNNNILALNGKEYIIDNISFL